MSAPTHKDVGIWVTIYQSARVTVQHGMVWHEGHDMDFYKVKGKTTRIFYGESAHMDSARFASDIDFFAGGW
jgi:hypothetical protein